MLTQFTRSEMLFGKDLTEKLSRERVVIFGLGGVGSFVVEGLVRGGIKKFVLFDNDTVNITNLNRQLIATQKTIGLPKVEVMRDRILDINPKAEVSIHESFITISNFHEIDFSDFSYVVDCIDTLSSKLLIIEEASRLKIPLISCMGTGNKIEPSLLEITDINKTSICPLARLIRQEVKKRGIKKLKVLYSSEIPIKTLFCEEVSKIDSSGGRPVPGSVSFVPSVAGLLIAGEVIKDLLKK